MSLLGDVPRSLVLGLSGAAAIFFALAQLAPSNAYWPGLATDSIAVLVGVLVVDRLLTRHQQAKWSAADRYASLRTLRLVERGMTALRLALGVRYSTLVRMKSDHASVARVETANYGYFTDNVEHRLRELLSAATPEATARLIGALHQLERDCERHIELFAHRIEPLQATLLLTVCELSSDLLQPFEAIPELTDSDAAASGRREVCWVSVEELVVSKAVQLSRALRALGEGAVESIRTAG